MYDTFETVLEQLLPWMHFLAAAVGKQGIRLMIEGAFDPSVDLSAILEETPLPAVMQTADEVVYLSISPAEEEAADD